MNDRFNILITGAAGFIGSSIVTQLNSRGFYNLLLVDHFNKPEKDRYLSGKVFREKINVDDLFVFLGNYPEKIHFVFHLGGKTSYKTDFVRQNLEFPQILFNWCQQRNTPFVYASSAATYGSGSQGYDDDIKSISTLNPISDYGKSKHLFDCWMLDQKEKSKWAGLKIFNVFGPNEYQKGMSASVAFKSFFEIKNTGRVVLFGSSDKKYLPGEQLRDFIYVKDVVNVFCWFWEKWIQSPGSMPTGIFNVGTGKGRSFNDVVKPIFHALNLPEKIDYKPIPDEILKNYPEFIIARMEKLRKIGYDIPMWSLEAAIDDLVKNYLIPGKIL